MTDDRELWRASLDGDGGAFAQLWDRHRDRVFRSTLRIADTRHDAEDLVAGAFLELWRHRARIRLVDESVLPWLLVTAFNLGRNARRGLRRHRNFLATLAPAEASPDHSDDALDRVASLRDERSLAAVVRGLPSVDREILVLVALEDLSIAEAAELLGIRPEAAKTRLVRARRRARLQWDALGGPDRIHNISDLEEGSTP